MSNDAQNIEALLFTLGRPLSRQEIKKQLNLDDAALEAAINELRERQGGVALVDDGRELSLRTTAQTADVVERVRKEEYARDIGKAGLEALSAILYRGPLSRAEIDFIRGVNSSQTLRTLTMRGLVRRVPNPKDERQYLYEPTGDLLSQLGVQSVKDLPDYEVVRAKLAQLEQAYRQSQSGQGSGQESEQ